MNSNEERMVSVAKSAWIYILSISQPANGDLWHSVTDDSTDLLSSYRQVRDESLRERFKDGICGNCGYTLSWSFTFSTASSVCAAIVISILFTLLSHLLYTEETMVTDTHSFVGPDLN